MKKIFILFTFISVLSGAKYAHAQAGAATMISYLTGVDAKKITNTMTMIAQVKETVELGIQTKNSISSIGDAIKQFEEDKKMAGGVEKMFAEFLDERIEDLKEEGDDMLNQNYIDFYDVYMETSYPFRNTDGSLDLFAMGQEQLTGNGLLTSAMDNFTSAAVDAQKDKIYDFHEHTIKNRTALRLIRRKKIRTLEKLARNKELKAIGIHYELGYLNVKSSVEGIGSISGDEDQRDGRKMLYNQTREEINDKIKLANTLLDESKILRREIRKLHNEPIPLMDFERQYIEKLNKISAQVEESNTNSLMLTSIDKVKIQAASRDKYETDYMEVKGPISGTPGFNYSNNNNASLSYNSSGMINKAVYVFFYQISTYLDIIMIGVILLLSFKTAAKFVSGDGNIKSVATLSMVIILWFIIVPEIIEILNSGPN